MTKRVFIVHGWDGYPEEAWFPWVKKKLEEEGFFVVVPQMPNAGAPEMDSWISFLHGIVGRSDEHTYFIGHSIGCQTVLRYLASLPEGIKAGGAVLVAGWVSLTPMAIRTAEDQMIARPWMERPIPYEKIISHTEKFVGIFSDDDPYVPIENQLTYREKLNADVLMLPGRGHFNEESNTKELPEAVSALNKMSNI